MNMKLNRSVYNTVISLAMTYVAETWATTKRRDRRSGVNEMIRWTCGVTRKRNEHIRGTTRVAQASEKRSQRDD